MRNVWRPLGTFTAFILLTISAAATASNEIEVNDSTGQANTLTSGQTKTGQLSSTTDQDYFKIATGSSGTLEITTSHTVNQFTNIAAIQALDPSLNLILIF